VREKKGMQAPGRLLLTNYSSWYHRCMKAIATRQRGAERLLDQIRSTFGLSESDLADLLGVRRQSVAEWREFGVPSQRMATIEHVAGLAKALRNEVIPAHIPEIVRRKDAWLDNKSILQTIAHDGVDRVYAYLHRLFTYRGS
jgi:DNA-binding XRE family transcriptional regulator